MAQPKVTSVQNAPFPVTVEVYFDSAMLDDENLSDPGNYLFNQGAYVTKVLVLNDTSVTLIVQNLFEYDDFTVAVQNVKSSLGEVIDPSFNSWTFIVSRPNIPGYSLAISAANGRLKSGVHVVKIDGDSDRWYVMTESGVDIVDRDSLMNSGFILDREGFNAIHVSKH